MFAEETAAICSLLEWDASVNPIEVVSATRAQVFCTGTVLRPQEWDALVAITGRRLPDGRQIVVRDVPRDISIGGAFYRNGRLVVQNPEFLFALSNNG